MENKCGKLISAVLRTLILNNYTYLVSQ